jgi:hypothetical protein
VLLLLLSLLLGRGVGMVVRAVVKPVGLAVGSLPRRFIKKCKSLVSNKISEVNVAPVVEKKDCFPVGVKEGVLRAGL